jgi:hypothetical protein
MSEIQTQPITGSRLYTFRGDHDYEDVCNMNTALATITNIRGESGLTISLMDGDIGRIRYIYDTWDRRGSRGFFIYTADNHLHGHHRLDIGQVATVTLKGDDLDVQISEIKKAPQNVTPSNNRTTAAAAEQSEDGTSRSSRKDWLGTLLNASHRMFGA